MRVLVIGANSLESVMKLSAKLRELSPEMLTPVRKIPEEIPPELIRAIKSPDEFINMKLLNQRTKSWVPHFHKNGFGCSNKTKIKSFLTQRKVISGK